MASHGPTASSHEFPTNTALRTARPLKILLRPFRRGRRKAFPGRQWWCGKGCWWGRARFSRGIWGGMFLVIIRPSPPSTRIRTIFWRAAPGRPCVAHLSNWMNSCGLIKQIHPFAIHRNQKQIIHIIISKVRRMQQKMFHNKKTIGTYWNYGNRRIAYYFFNLQDMCHSYTKEKVGFWKKKVEMKRFSFMRGSSGLNDCCPIIVDLCLAVTLHPSILNPAIIWGGSYRSPWYDLQVYHTLIRCPRPSASQEKIPKVNKNVLKALASK